MNDHLPELINEFRICLSDKRYFARVHLGVEPTPLSDMLWHAQFKPNFTAMVITQKFMQHQELRHELVKLHKRMILSHPIMRNTPMGIWFENGSVIRYSAPTEKCLRGLTINYLWMKELTAQQEENIFYFYSAPVAEFVKT